MNIALKNVTVAMGKVSALHDALVAGTRHAADGATIRLLRSVEGDLSHAANELMAAMGIG